MDSRIKNDMEIPECFRQIQELLDGTVMYRNSPSPDEAIKKLDRTAKQQMPSLYGTDEIQIEIRRLRSEIDSLNAYNRSLERDNTEMAHVVSENQELRNKLDALEKSLEAKDAESRSPTDNVTELAHIGVQLQALKDDTNTLVTENRILRESIDEFKTHAKAFSDKQTAFSELQGKLTSEQKINEELRTKLSESSSALEQITGLSQRLRSRNQETERELEEYRAKLDAAEKDRDWHRKQHTEILEVGNTTKAARASDDNRLLQENSKLKQDYIALARELRRHLRGVADFITQLDLAEEEVRVYTCAHKNFKEITPYSDKSTRIKPMSLIASEIYKHWADEKTFQEEYQHARKAICNHHGAHAKAGHVNGDTVHRLYSVLKDLDWRRGVSQPSS